MKNYIFSHVLVVPNNPFGLIINTTTTNKVAKIFAIFGEKNTEIIPSLIPINIAATTVPFKLPKPPIITTQVITYHPLNNGNELAQ